MQINQFLDQFKRSLGVMKKDIRIYYLKGPVVIFGFLMPLFLFLAFFIGSRDLSIDFLISGLITMTVFFTATAVSPVIAPWEAQVQTLERLISAPISITTLIFGDMLASFIFGIIIPILPIAISLAMGVNIIQPIILLLGILLATACFSSFGLILSSPPANAPSNVMMISSLVRFPLVFLSGIFIPIEQMPYWGKIIASFFPLTYLADLTRYSINGANYYPIQVDFVVIIFFTILFFFLAVQLHKRTIYKRI
ncbi:ABC transporter permease [Methanobacterium petrolearium]|uniref:ABC transporter permease n=1 Tax=Methanobacterium petrolearium TaxID=710190 RepID=UPI001AE9951E|nr:ABC transporter permease [Methanobacterium petrolearium]MBP1946771.1 ABC-2 type transport system permease protein [Methanobacterium petrolearium]